MRSPCEVDAVLVQARRAGVTIPRGGATTFWGGYSGIFVDLDGHPWEVAHNPHWVLGDDGSISFAECAQTARRRPRDLERAYGSCRRGQFEEEDGDG